jgi:predicted HicB family RNase H-like nuclease
MFFRKKEKKYRMMSYSEYCEKWGKISRKHYSEITDLALRVPTEYYRCLRVYAEVA